MENTTELPMGSAAAATPDPKTPPKEITRRKNIEEDYRFLESEEGENFLQDAGTAVIQNYRLALS